MEVLEVLVDSEERRCSIGRFVIMDRRIKMRGTPSVVSHTNMSYLDHVCILDQKLSFCSDLLGQKKRAELECGCPHPIYGGDVGVVVPAPDHLGNVNFF